MNLWTRIQLLKTTYQMGALNKAQFIYQLGQLYIQAKRVAQVNVIWGNIVEQMAKPALQELTSDQMRVKADRKREYATQIKLNGGRVKPDYE